MYDPLIGRWLQVDPYGEFSSPYVMMGNYPHAVDPDGGKCKGCPDTEQYQSVINDDNDWIYNASDGSYALSGFENLTGSDANGTVVVMGSRFFNAQKIAVDPTLGQMMDMQNQMADIEAMMATINPETVGTVLALYESGGLGGRSSFRQPMMPRGTKLPNLGNKLEFAFGNATGRLHNLQRSTTMMRQLNKIGIFNNAAGKSHLVKHLNRVFLNTKNVLSNEGGFVTKESILMGPNGGLKMQSVWKGRDLITIKLMGG